MKIGNREKWFKFALYLAVILLINMVSETLFFRIDLTENRTYSLSGASKNLVASLEEPLTVKVFLSENLPQPYNNLEQQMKDLLEEYALEGNRNFNYSLYLLDQEGTAVDEGGRNLRLMAEDYKIPAIQIQNVEQDEVKLQTAYMGMVLIQGDLVETIPALGNETNPEFRISSTIDRISRKTSTLLAMDDSVEIKLVLSSALAGMNSDLAAYGESLKTLVNKLNRSNFGKLKFSQADPSVIPANELKKYGLNTIRLTSGTREAPIESTAYAGVVVKYRDEVSSINLLNQGLFGGYSLTSTADLENPVVETVEKLIGINQSIGYLTSHGTPALYSNPYAQQQGKSVGNFYQLISGDYNVKSVTLDSIPGDIQTLVIAGPTEPFSDWELFQIDQFIMKGGSVALFLDSHSEIMPSQQEMMYGQMPSYIPLFTGLEKLTGHYGAAVQQSYIMDENCFVQRGRNALGSIEETPIFFAPQIGMESINNDLAFMKNIKGLIMLNISPIKINTDGSTKVKADSLFSSSDSSWAVSENINLYNPAGIYPPSKDDREAHDLGVLLEGTFTSYFDGKELPARPQPEEGEDTEEMDFSSDTVSGEISYQSESAGGKIFLVGSSVLLGDNVIDKSGVSPNAMFIQNTLDYLNGREDYAVMRSKGQGYNPLEEVNSSTKALIKGFNIIVLPILIILTGLAMWFYWSFRKKKIAMMFMENEI